MQAPGRINALLGPTTHLNVLLAGLESKVFGTLIMHKTLIMCLKCSLQISININVLCCDWIAD